MRSRFIVSMMLLAAAPLCRADVLYQFSVDTSSISGTVGSLDFQFNPGPFVSQTASLSILDFAGDGTLSGSPSLTGDVSGGPLPSTLIFDNGSAFNDYFEDFTFGSTLSFEVSLSGPAVDAPDGTSTSGSTFAFSMFSDAAGTIPALTTDSANGFATTVDINLDGSATATNLSTQTTISPGSTAPEPNTCVLIGSAMVLLGSLRWRRRASLRTRCNITG